MNSRLALEAVFAFFFWLVLTQMIGTRIKVRGRRPLSLLLGLEYLRQILIFFLHLDSFFFAFSFLLQGAPFPDAVPGVDTTWAVPLSLGRVHAGLGTVDSLSST